MAQGYHRGRGPGRHVEFRPDVLEVGGDRTFRDVQQRGDVLIDESIDD
jgi:hypothetical protein